MKRFLFFWMIGLAVSLSTPARAQSNAPANLKATATAYNRVVLTWDDKSTNESRFEIERNAFVGFTKIDQVNANSTTYTDNSVSGNGSYTYRIKAVFASGASYSNEVTVSTPAEPVGIPTDLIVSVQGSNSVRLTWKNGSGTTPANYRVEKASSPGGPFSLLQTVAYSRSPTFTDNGVSGGQTVCYRVRSQNGNQVSDFTAAVCATTSLAPSNVTNLQAEALNPSSIKLTWTPYGKETTIYIERRLSSATNWERIKATLADLGTFTDTGLNSGTNYCYRIGEDGHEYSATVCKATPAVVPVTPTQLTVLSISTSQLQVFWTDVNVVPVTFEISRADKPGGTYQVIQPDYGQKIYDDKNLPASTQYCYRVRAKNGSTYSDYSGEACGTTKTPAPTPPGAPRNLQITNVASNLVDLQWSDGSDNETGFRIERADGPNAAFVKLDEVSVNTTTYRDQSVQPSKSYCYRVQAINAVGTSEFTEAKCTTTPAPPPGIPTDLKATVQSPTQIDVSFSASNASAGDTYEVQRSTAGGGYAFLKNVPLDANGKGGLSDTGLQPNTRYCYRVRRSSRPQTDFSGEVCAVTPDIPPAAPARLSITAVVYNQVSLQWADLSGNESTFVLERSDDGTNFKPIKELSANTTQYDDPTVAPQNRYFYRVYARNAAGSSAPSNVVDVTTPIGPPVAAQDLKATAISTTQISLTWGTIPNAATIVLERSSDGTTGWSTLATVTGNTTSYTDGNLTPNTRYFYRIRASNGSGTGQNSNVAEASTPDVPPAAPARLTAVVVSPTQVKLQWADLSSNESGFEIEQSGSAGGTFSNVGKEPANTVQFDVKGLTDATAYCFRVRAINAAGPSDYTETVCVTTPLAPPSRLQAQVFDYDQVRLTWDPLSAKAVTVKIERSISPNGPFQEIKQLPAINLTLYVDGGLQEYTTYYYRIRATNAAGDSEYSNVAQARIEEIVIGVEDEWITQTQVYADERTLHLRTDWYRPTVAQVQLHNLHGRVLLTDTRRVASTDAWSYALPQAPAGLYILSVLADGRIFTKKILLP